MSCAPARALAGLIAALLASCSLTIDESELGGGDGTLECSSSEKTCDVEGVAQCVGLDDPSFGCSRPGCTPCSLPKATAICNPETGACVVGACNGTWENCDRVASNGCEINVADNVDNCGECGKRCPARPNAEVACGGTSCYIRRCTLDYKNCNDEFEDGCEIDTRTSETHCGECNQPCKGTCVEGKCEPV